MWRASSQISKNFINGQSDDTFHHAQGEDAEFFSDDLPGFPKLTWFCLRIIVLDTGSGWPSVFRAKFEKFASFAHSETSETRGEGCIWNLENYFLFNKLENFQSS